MKKILALVLAALMLLGMTAALAEANVYTVANPNEDYDVSGHTFKAYQIFTATSYNSTTKEYGNLDFSDNVSSDAKTALLGSYEDAQALAATLGENDSEAATAFAKAVFAQLDELGEGVELSSDALAIGLWLIVDESAPADVEVVNWANLFASDGTTAPTAVSKVDAPESDKKVKDANDTDGTTTGWQDSADYDVGDDVPFQLTATLPGNYTSYDTYHLSFHDVMGAGLSFNEESVAVYIGTSTTAVDAANYTLDTDPEDGHTFDIDFTYENLTALEVSNGTVIRVEYTATLTGANVVYGKAGNPNTSWITYDNNPNSEQEGENETPHDTVIVFTYKTHVDKVDGEGEDLVGADFTLYKLVPDETEGASTGADIKATFAAGVEASALEDAKYYIEVETKTGTTEGSEFEFAGVDDGTYVLVETTIPDGYNAWHSAAVIVDATHNTSCAIDPTTGKVDGSDTYVLTSLADDNGTLTTVDADLSTLSDEIENLSGLTLPSTGGIGTTIFYVVGGILVLGAIIFLVTKRRMHGND